MLLFSLFRVSSDSDRLCLCLPSMGAAAVVDSGCVASSSRCRAFLQSRIPNNAGNAEGVESICHYIYIYHGYNVRLIYYYYVKMQVR